MSDMKTDSSKMLSCPMISCDKIPAYVRDLVYWKAPIKSAIVMVAGLTILFSLGCLSMISVFAYLCLAVLCCTGAWKIYFDLITSKKEGNTSATPFGEYLSKDFVVPSDRVNEFVNKSLEQSSDCINYLKQVLLIENYLTSLKFALYMYLFSILGGFFNLITITIICFIAVFSIPKLYEMFKPQIDKYVDTARIQVDNVWSKIQTQLDRIPMLRKQKSN